MSDENVNAETEQTPVTAGETHEDSALDTAAAQVRAQREERVPHKVLEDKPVENSMRELRVEIPREEWQTRIDAMFKEWRKTAAIEGFRRGKAPVGLLKRRFMREASGEVMEKLVPAIVRQYEEDSKLTLYGVPMVTELKTEDGPDPVVTVRVEVKPEINPKDYKDIAIDVPQVRLPENIVETNLENMRQQAATFEEVERGIEGHDAAVLDVKVVDSKGRTIAQESNKLFEHLHDAFPAEVLAELNGKKAGDTVELSAPSMQRAGQTERYTLTVKSVKALKTPELDDEFAKDLGHESLDAMRATLTERNQKYVDDANADEAFESLVLKLLETHDFEVPPTLQARVKEDMMRTDMNYMYRTGAMPARAAGRNAEEYQTQAEEDARARVRGLLLVDAIGLAENITAEEADIMEALEERGKEEGRKGVAIRAALEKRREYGQFVEQVRFAKVRKYILDNNKVTYVDPPAEEVKPEEEAAGEGAKKDA
ncbi:trigger factor [candidate division BRC1 bacterium HGW-BRC1-1]|nr:MAG: trigger factor [candidate division BRC1 bacterium HGW-BRC1-1]